MEVPGYLHQHAAQLLGIETEAAIYRELAEKRRSYWATILGLTPKKDGNQWYVLYGEDIQAGIVGFGYTPEEAIEAFEREMRGAK